jgi:uncharacterized protein YbjT (DUF2867 family)
MRILLTGATGHSGRWFIKRLIEENFKGELVCLVREGGDVSLLEKSGLQHQIIYGRIGEGDSLDRALEGIDVVVHIAGIQISRLVMQAAINQGVSWAILVHTTGRFSKYKSASSEYIAIEEDILKMRDQIDITVLRPTMIYGSTKDVNMHKLLLYLNRHGYFPLFGKGNNLMQPVHARDLGNAYYDVLQHEEQTKNKEYNLPGKEPLSYIEVRYRPVFFAN